MAGGDGCGYDVIRMYSSATVLTAGPVRGVKHNNKAKHPDGISLWRRFWTQIITRAAFYTSCVLHQRRGLTTMLSEQAEQA